MRLRPFSASFCVGAVLGCIVLAATLGLSGCRSHMVSVVIRNEGHMTVRLLEVDYPSASFGMSSLAAGAEYHYQFKIQGSGPVTLEYTDLSYKTHKVTGPQLYQGQDGTLQIVIGEDGKVTWTPYLHPKQ
jgi:hypothetical protein